MFESEGAFCPVCETEDLLEQYTVTQKYQIARGWEDERLTLTCKNCQGEVEIEVRVEMSFRIVEYTAPEDDD